MADARPKTQDLSAILYTARLAVMEEWVVWWLGVGNRSGCCEFPWWRARCEGGRCSVDVTNAHNQALLAVYFCRSQQYWPQWRWNVVALVSNICAFYPYQGQNQVVVSAFPMRATWEWCFLFKERGLEHWLLSSSCKMLSDSQSSNMSATRSVAGTEVKKEDEEEGPANLNEPRARLIRKYHVLEAVDLAKV